MGTVFEKHLNLEVSPCVILMNNSLGKAGFLGPSDAELVQLCLQGDNYGFDLLVRRYQRQVHVFCYRMLGSDSDAADAAQESFLKAYRALGRFRQDAKFLTWLLRIASNTCVDMGRRRSVRQAASLDDPVGEAEHTQCSNPSPEETALRNETNRLIGGAISALPDKYRSAVVMFHFNEMSIREISEALGRPEGTVKSDLHAGREMLRRKLEGMSHEMQTGSRSTELADRW